MVAHAGVLISLRQDIEHVVPFNWIQMDPGYRRVAYINWDASNGVFALYLRGLNSTQDVRIGDSKGHAMAPVWSPDGQKIAYLQSDSDSILSTQKQIAIYDVAGGVLKTLPTPPRRLINVSFSGDGQSVYAIAYKVADLASAVQESQVYMYALAGSPNETLLFEEHGYIPQIFEVPHKAQLFYLLFNAPTWPYGSGWYFDKATQSVRALQIRLEPSDYSGSHLLGGGFQALTDPGQGTLWLGTGRQVFSFSFHDEHWQRWIAATRFAVLSQGSDLLISRDQNLYLKQPKKKLEPVADAPRGELLAYRPGALLLYVPSESGADIQRLPVEVSIRRPVSKMIMVLYVGLVAVLAALLIWRYKKYKELHHIQNQGAGDVKPAVSPLQRLTETELPAPPAKPDAVPLSERIKRLKSSTPPSPEAADSPPL